LRLQRQAAADAFALGFFLSGLALAGALGAGAAGAVVLESLVLGVLGVLGVLAEEDVLESLDDDDEQPSPGLVEEYRSLYQPPPLSWNEVRLSSRFIVRFLPQCGQGSGAGSSCFCKTSSRWLQALQRYSKIGMGHFLP
jgi:hypothetical protein